MTRNRLRLLVRSLPVAILAVALMGPPAGAQDRGFLDDLFNNNDRGQEQAPPGRVAQADNDLSMRIDRIEGALRQLTGTVEQLQYQNQQLQAQIRSLQGEGGAYRAPQPGPAAAPPPGQAAPPPYAPPPSGQPAEPGRRSDAFDPAQHPNAPGAPRVLGTEAPMAQPQTAGGPPPIGAPGGREAGAPLDLTSLSANPNHGGAPGQPDGQLPPPPPRNTSATGPQLATLPPTARPQDEYDMAYGYVLHKDYGLAEQAFRDFLRKYPNEHLVPDAQYWMGESLYQQQRYRDAAEAFLTISTKYERSGKAPDALLRLGQSLAAMGKKEAACATFAEVGRKYPRASSSVKRGVTQEQKRVHC